LFKIYLIYQTYYDNGKNTSARKNMFISFQLKKKSLSGLIVILLQRLQCFLNAIIRQPEESQST
jgi:hypothetical protein